MDLIRPRSDTPVAAGFAVLFTLVVAMGYIPSFVTATHGEERTLFDLFKISLLDDVTHAGTAVAALAAAVTSRRAALLFLTAFGFYYALDAAFYLTYGVLSGQAPAANLMLNAPHIAIATVMLGLVYWWVPREGAPAVAG
jgi:arginine exporter protein ArgO